jgi:hypothetical protein
MATSLTTDTPVRVGVFSDVASTERAISRLLAAGTRREQITVICSDETKERYFREFERQKPAGSNAPAAAAAGGTFGAALGGMATLAGGIALGGLPLLVLGGAGILTGGVVGGFLGAMLSRGFEKEAANFYDQAVQRGKLLIAVEDHTAAGPENLARAERILAESGAERPMPLPEG